MKVAILVPTKNRPDFIERMLGYYDFIKCKHSIYIGDASDEDTAARLSLLIKRFNNVNVKYFHWKDLSVSHTIPRLAQNAVQECQYCALHGDDDYFIPSSLSRCAAFLSENSDYRTAQGRGAYFYLDRPGPYGNIRALGDLWGVNELEQETGVERFSAFYKNYFPTYFSTHRTEEFLKDSHSFSEITDHCNSELACCYTSAIKGKSKFLDCLYIIVNYIDRVRQLSPVEWIMQEHWSSEYHKTINALAIAVHETSDLSLDDSKEVVYKEFKNYVEDGMISLSVRNKESLSNKIRKSLPAGLIKELRKIKMFISHLRDIFYFSNDSKDMRRIRSKRSAFYHDFLPVLVSLSKKS